MIFPVEVGHVRMNILFLVLFTIFGVPGFDSMRFDIPFRSLFASYEPIFVHKLRGL
jgi:hypothetical protein